GCIEYRIRGEDEYAVGHTVHDFVFTGIISTKSYTESFSNSCWKAVAYPQITKIRRRGCCRSASQNIGVCFFKLRIIVRSEEHTSELQSRENLVCRLLLEKK